MHAEGCLGQHCVNTLTKLHHALARRKPAPNNKHLSIKPSAQQVFPYIALFMRATACAAM